MNLATRACVATYGLGLLFTALSVRLCYLAVDKHEHYAEVAQTTYEAKVTIPARRGAITDLHGTVLARNRPLKNVIADDTLLYHKDERTQKVRRDDRDKAVAILVKHLQKSHEEIRAAIKPETRYVRVAMKVSEEVASAIGADVEKAGIKGIYFEPSFDRVYPAGSLLSHVLGFYGHETWLDKESGKKVGAERGLEGVERSMNVWLTGQDGWRYFDKDALGRELATYRRDERAPKHGANVRLTIDLGIQQIVEAELQQAFEELKPKKATVVMMDPKTGEIMAMANRPHFNPNEPTKAEAGHRLNHAIASIYEPGSTFKTLSAAGALNRSLTRLDESIWCRNGTWSFVGGKITDHHPYGNLTVTEIIAKSSNIGAVILAKRMGDRAFHDWIRTFGFGTRTGVALPGEAHGIVHPLNKWRANSMFYVPFGHEVAATPLQVVMATCVFANGGKLMMPQIIKEVTDENGNVLVNYPSQELNSGFIREDTCRKITETLEKTTVKGGTATRAAVPGFRVAGKTGTTQLFDEKLRRYSNQDHTVSFVGYMPAENPRFCCLVMIEDSAVVNGRTDTGGLLAAPVFARIAHRTARHLGLQPDPTLLGEEVAEDEKQGMGKR
jgi:cell division protein FtsI/penicillin-binding protein 2